MSSPLGGKFQDHYAVLGIEATADSETIQSAYQLVVVECHPETGFAPNADKFKTVTAAFEVLSDPAGRAEFDSVRGAPKYEPPHKFSGLSFFETIEGEPIRRMAILCLLYDRARTKPSKPGLSLRQTEAILNMPGDDMRFAVAYLKQRGLVVSDDKSNILITVDGMVHLENANPPADRILPLLTDKAVPAEEKAGPVEDDMSSLARLADAIAGPAAEPPTHEHEPHEHEPLEIVEVPHERTVSENLAARIRSRMSERRSPPPSS